MAQAPTLTPEQQAQIQAFFQKYPNVPHTGGLINAMHMPQQMRNDYIQLVQATGFQQGGANQDFRITPDGQVRHDDSGKKFALMAAGTLAGPIAMAAMPAAGAATAGGGVAHGGAEVGYNALGSVVGGGGGAGAAAGGAAGAAGGMGAASAAGGIGSRLLQAGVGAGLPLAFNALANRGGDSTTSLSPGGANSEQLNDMLAMMNRRLQRTEPVHEAAMRLAQSLAPTGENNPRMQQQIQASAGPAPQSQMNPQVADAVRRLMAGR